MEKVRIGRYRGKWALRWRDAEGDHRQTTGLAATAENYPLAERYAEAHRDQLAARKRSEDPTLGEIYERYRQECTRRGIVGMRAVEQAWHHLRAYERLRVADLDEAFGEQYIKLRRGGKASDATVRLELSYLRAALACSGWKVSFVLPKAPAPKDRVITPDEARQIIHHASPHIALYVRLALNTAGRKEALLGLTWSTHIKWDRDRIWMGFKEGGKPRAGEIPMNDGTKKALQEAYEMRRCDHVIEYNGQPVLAVRKGLAAAGTRAGVEGVTPHVLRHTAATWAVQSGVPIAQVSKWLGHTSVRTTEANYLHLTPDFLADAVKVGDV